MKYIAILALVFLVSLAAPPAWALRNDENPYQLCQSFSECTIVWGGCSDVAINKRYVQQFKPSGVCDATKQHDPAAVPTCEDNKCVVVAPDKKDGSVN